MLMRMYLRWFENRGFKVEVNDVQEGGEAGITSATITVEGENAYGLLASEKGVHRLVRLSPFDSANRRHTSFAAVEVGPLVSDDVDIDIDEDDLRVDTYRSSGAGGQHVNKTSSAVRITHIPTGIVVQCQNERSQISNRATAMRMLKSRLVELEERKRAEELARERGEQLDVNFGSQIRSYVLHPYQMVKDLRTDHETGNTQAVLDGDLDPFVHAYLMWRAASEQKSAREPGRRRPPAPVATLRGDRDAATAHRRRRARPARPARRSRCGHLVAAARGSRSTKRAPSCSSSSTAWSPARSSSTRRPTPTTTPPRSTSSSATPGRTAAWAARPCAR